MKFHGDLKVMTIPAFLRSFIKQSPVDLKKNVLISVMPQEVI